jgi:hypothetical protein
LPAIIGNAEFVREAVRKNKHRIAAMRRFKNDPEALDMLARKACAKYKISGKELKWQGRCNARSAARREFCAKAYDELHAPVTNIARYLDLTPPPVSILLRQWKENTLKIK